MNLRISSCIILLLFFATGCREKTERIVKKQGIFSDGPLFEANTLLENFELDSIIIIDFRTPESYMEGHVPGAINLWRSDIDHVAYPYRGMMPSRVQLESLLSRSGISSTDDILIYDDKGSVDAARLWWILNYYGYNKAGILNGGLSAWKDSGGTVELVPVSKPASTFTFQESVRENLLVHKEVLRHWIERPSPGIKIIDVRSADEYSGRVLKEGATRSGRIPGSIHIEWSQAIDAHNSNKFRSVEDLKKIYASYGIDPKDTLVVYCHSGSRSSHTAFVLLELMDHPHVKNYDGSWTEWSYFEHFAIEKDTLILQNN